MRTMRRKHSVIKARQPVLTSSFDGAGAVGGRALVARLRYPTLEDAVFDRARRREAALADKSREFSQPYVAEPVSKVKTARR